MITLIILSLGCAYGQGSSSGSASASVGALSFCQPSQALGETAHQASGGAPSIAKATHEKRGAVGAKRTVTYHLEQ